MSSDPLTLCRCDPFNQEFGLTKLKAQPPNSNHLWKHVNHRRVNRWKCTKCHLCDIQETTSMHHQLRKPWLVGLRFSNLWQLAQMLLESELRSNTVRPQWSLSLESNITVMLENSLPIHVQKPEASIDLSYFIFNKLFILNHQQSNLAQACFIVYIPGSHHYKHTCVCQWLKSSKRTPRQLHNNRPVIIIVHKNHYIR